MPVARKILLLRLLAGSALLFYLLRFLEHTTPSRLEGPVLINPQLDVTYWLYILADLPSIIVGNRTGAILFDGSMFLTGALVILFPLKRVWVICFTLLQILYAITFNTFVMHHGAPMNGLMIVFLPFWSKDLRRNDLLWQALRYYVCMIYFLAFFWKTAIGDSFFYWDQGVSTFKFNLVEYMYHNPGTFMTGIYRWFLRHGWALNLGAMLVVLAEGVMAIGFFTKKWDRFLFWMPVFIHAATYFFSDVYFMEMLVLDLSLLSMRSLDRIAEIFPIFTYRRNYAEKNYQKGLSSAR